MQHQPLPSIAALIRLTWPQYKQHAKTYLLILAIPTLCEIFQTLARTYLLDQNNKGLLTLLFQTFGWIGITLLLLLLFASVVVQLWSSLALIYAISDSTLSVKKAYSQAWSNLRSYFWINLLVSFITFGGFILLIIPAIIFSVWFNFSDYILVTENLKGMNALQRSKEYVKNRWWAIFLRLLFIFFLTFSLGIVGSLLSVNTAIVDTLLGFLITPILTIYPYQLYLHLKSSQAVNALPAIE